MSIMDETALADKLVLFGLGRQEAVVYLCLLRNGSLTGYEVSKQTGISRSNVYHSLAALTEHGAAYVMEGASSRYTAVSLEEFCDNRIRLLQEVANLLRECCPGPSNAVEGYITIEGSRHILDKIHHMLLGASRRVYFSASAAFLEKWREEIASLAKRKIKLVLIAEREPEGLPMEQIYFYRSVDREKEWEERDRQVRLIIDSAYVLTGELEGKDTDNCLYSAQRNLVNVFKEAVGNEIRLIEMSDRKE